MLLPKCLEEAIAAGKAKRPHPEHANKGLGLEHALETQHREYARRGIIVEKFPTPTRRVKTKTGVAWVQSGARVVDFIGVLSSGLGVVVEAKSTGDPRWSLGMLEDDQRVFLRRWPAFKLVVVEFTTPELRSVWAIPATALDDLEARGVKSLPHPAHLARGDDPRMNEVGVQLAGVDWLTALQVERPWRWR